MADPFVAEIRMFPFNFAPRGWATCDGQVLPISQNTALFSLLGTTYGGNGVSTFALPNLQGCVPLGTGQGPGMTDRVLGEMSGSAAVTLLESEIPLHTHTVQGSAQSATSNEPAGMLPAATLAAAYGSSAPVVEMAPQAIAPTGGGLPHNNMQPFLTLQFCIALQGVYPPRP